MSCVDCRQIAREWKANGWRYICQLRGGEIAACDLGNISSLDREGVGGCVDHERRDEGVEMTTIDNREASEMGQQIDWQEVRGGHALWEHVVRIKDAHGNRRGCWTETAREISRMLGREVTQFQCQYVYYQYKARPADGDAGRPGTANDANGANGMADGVMVEETVESDPFEDGDAGRPGTANDANEANGGNGEGQKDNGRARADDAVTVEETVENDPSEDGDAGRPGTANDANGANGMADGVGQDARPAQGEGGGNGKLKGRNPDIRLHIDPLTYRPKYVCRIEMELPGLSVRVTGASAAELFAQSELLEQWLGECRRMAEVAE